MPVKLETALFTYVSLICSGSLHVQQLVQPVYLNKILDRFRLLRKSDP